MNIYWSDLGFTANYSSTEEAIKAGDIEACQKERERNRYGSRKSKLIPRNAFQEGDSSSPPHSFDDDDQDESLPLQVPSLNTAPDNAPGPSASVSYALPKRVVVPSTPYQVPAVALTSKARRFPSDRLGPGILRRRRGGGGAKRPVKVKSKVPPSSGKPGETERYFTCNSCPNLSPFDDVFSFVGHILFHFSKNLN